MYLLNEENNIVIYYFLCISVLLIKKLEKLRKVKFKIVCISSGSMYYFKVNIELYLSYLELIFIV